MAADRRDATDCETDNAVDVGMAMARKIFEKRGNHYEIHLSEGELAGLLGAAYSARSEIERKPDYTVKQLESFQQIFENLRREFHRQGNWDGQSGCEFALEAIRRHQMGTSLSATAKPDFGAALEDARAIGGCPPPGASSEPDEALTAAALSQSDKDDETALQGIYDGGSFGVSHLAGLVAVFNAGKAARSSVATNEGETPRTDAAFVEWACYDPEDPHRLMARNDGWSLARQLEREQAALARQLRRAIEHGRKSDAALSARVEKDQAIVPSELTAENGMKAALIGEFFFYPYEGREPVIVPWDKIKEIHRRVVEISRQLYVDGGSK